MKVFNKDILVYLIKVFKNEDYRKDFINGHLYLNEAGYFNKLEDGYRGDKYDSKIVQVKPKILINEIEFTPDILIQGFVGDNKVPILCSTILNEQCLFVSKDNTIRIKQNVIDELKKFGDYGLIFYYGELKNNLDEYAKTNDIFVDQDIVKYCDIRSENSHSLYRGNIYNKYFIKDNSYKSQNELRFIFLSNNKIKFTPLVPENQDHIEIDIKPLQKFATFNLNDSFLSDLCI